MKANKVEYPPTFDFDNKSVDGMDPLDDIKEIENVQPQNADIEMKSNDEIASDDEDDDDEKALDLETISFSKRDPVEVYDTAKDVWIRAIFISEYNDGDQYLVEVPAVLESKVVSVKRQHVRYLRDSQPLTDDAVKSLQRQNSAKLEDEVSLFFEV